MGFRAIAAKVGVRIGQGLVLTSQVGFKECLGFVKSKISAQNIGLKKKRFIGKGAVAESSKALLLKEKLNKKQKIPGLPPNLDNR